MAKLPVAHRPDPMPTKHRCYDTTSYEALATRSFDRLLRQHRLEVRGIRWRYALAAVAVTILTSILIVLLTTGGP